MIGEKKQRDAQQVSTSQSGLVLLRCTLQDIVYSSLFQEWVLQALAFHTWVVDFQTSMELDSFSYLAFHGSIGLHIQQPHNLGELEVRPIRREVVVGTPHNYQLVLPSLEEVHHTEGLCCCIVDAARAALEERPSGFGSRIFKLSSILVDSCFFRMHSSF